MNRKTRPICHGRMGKGNNRCSRVSARVLAESLLGTIKSKANGDVTTRLNCHWHCCFYSFSAQNFRYICGRKKKKKKKKKREREREKKKRKKSWKWQLEYGHTSTSQLRISTLASTGRVQVTKKCHENSGGYACVYCLL